MILNASEHIMYMDICITRLNDIMCLNQKRVTLLLVDNPVKLIVLLGLEHLNMISSAKCL